MSVAVPLVLYRYPLPTKNFYGFDTFWQLSGVAVVTVVLLLLLSISAVGSGGDGGLARTGAPMGVLSYEVENLRTLAMSANETGAAVLEELSKLSTACPPQVMTVLGSSVQVINQQAQYLLHNTTGYAQLLEPLPGELDTMKGAAAGAGNTAKVLVSLSILTSLMLVSGLGIALADVHFLDRKLERLVGRISSYEGPVLVIIGGFATFLSAAAAASVLALGGNVGHFCRDVDEESLRFLGTEFGWNSSAYSLGRFYIASLGQNPLVSTVSGATTASRAVQGWISEFEWAISKSCPTWSADRMQSELKAIGETLASSNRLIEPQGVYSIYTQAARNVVCDDALPTLGWELLLLILITFLALPALTYTGNQFLKAFVQGRCFSRLPQEDKHEEEDDLVALYPAVYGFSVLTLITGTLMYFMPNLTVPRRIIGTLLYMVGIFLVMNSDLIVTMARLHLQMDHFKSTNSRLAEDINIQAQEVRRLSKASKGLDTISKRFGGNMKQAMKEVKRLSDVCRSDIKLCCKNLLRLYSEKGNNRSIPPGKDLEDSLELFKLVFAGVFRGDYTEREKALRAGLAQRRGARDNTPIPEALLSDLQATVLSEPDINRLPELVKKSLERADKVIVTQPATQPSSPSAGQPVHLT